MYIMYFLFCSISHIFLDNCAVLEGYIHERICRGMYHDYKQKALQCTCDALVGL